MTIYVSPRNKTSKKRFLSSGRHALWVGRRNTSVLQRQSLVELEVGFKGERLCAVSSIQDMDGVASKTVRSCSPRQKLQDTVRLCFPTRTYNKQLKPLFSNKRKIHLSELMPEKCPFPASSHLAPKWHLTKQHSAPVNPHSPFLIYLIHPWFLQKMKKMGLERRQLRTEEGVAFPPNAQILIFEAEATAQVTPSYKLRPKLAPGMTNKWGQFCNSTS